MENCKQKGQSFEFVLSALSRLACATVAKRIVCAVLLCHGAAAAEAAAAVGLDIKSVYKYRRMIEAGDAAALLEMKPRGRKSALEPHRGAVAAALDGALCRTLKAVRAAALAAAGGIKLSQEAVRVFVKKLGFRKLMPSSAPAKADPDDQRGFYKTVLLPLMRYASGDECGLGLYFVDAAHFVHGCERLRSAWGRARALLKTFSGRKRYNVLGALDYASKKLAALTNDTRITSARIADMVELLAGECGAAGKRAVLVLDNAACNRGKAVAEKAEELGVSLVCLPAYSPNLNLIERAWRMARGLVFEEASLSESFDEFKRHIDGAIELMNDRLNGDFARLTSEKVQFFDSSG